MFIKPAILLKTGDVVIDIPVYGTCNAIKDILEKFDSSLVPLYLKIGPSCWHHDHADGVFINCVMDSQKNFKVVGLTKIDLK